MSALTTEDIVLITVGVSVTIAILLIFFFVITVRYFRINRKKQREIFESVLAAQENERFRIARDLHDEINPMLAAIKLNLGLLNKQQDEAFILSTVKESQEHLDISIQDIRRISHNLVPKKITQQGLAGAVEEYVRYLKQ